jgi:signal peptidase I
MTSGGPYVEYRVPAEVSMSPTLVEGDLITVRTDTASDLRRGDIVLIEPDAWLVPTDAPVVKRVVAIGGDQVRGSADGRIEVNGRAVDEDYLSNDELGPDGFPEFETTVPDRTVFVAGDQRNNSVDSRMLVDEPSRGAFEPEAVMGTVVAINGDPLSATTAFVDAGLSGDAYEDTTLTGTRLVVLIAGAVGALAGVAWLIVNVLRRRTKAVPVAA